MCVGLTCFFFQVCYGVQYCHKNKIVHRDIKPENLMLDDRGGWVKGHHELPT